MEPESEAVSVEPEEALVLQEEKLRQMLVVILLIKELEELESEPEVDIILNKGLMQII